LTGAALGFLLGLPWLAVMALASQLTGLPYPPFELFEWFTRILPGDLVTSGLEGLIRLINLLDLGQLPRSARPQKF
jgi:hypothetical protein